MELEGPWGGVGSVFDAGDDVVLGGLVGDVAGDKGMGTGRKRRTRGGRIE